MRPSCCAPIAVVLAAAPCASPSGAQSGGFAAGDLVLFSPSLNGIPSTSGGIAIVGALTGTVSEPYAFWTTPSLRDACAYDPYRDRLLFAAGFLDGDPTGLWAGDAAGVVESLFPGSGSVRALAPTGDGRVYFHWGSGSSSTLSYLDAADQLHSLMDATGTAPWMHANSGVLGHLEYDAHRNALVIASASNTPPCTDHDLTKLTVWRLDLSGDGTRVVAESCTRFDVVPTGVEWPVGLARIDADTFLVVVDTNSNQEQPRLLSVTVDPLAVDVYSTTGYFGSAATSAGTYSHTLGRAVLFDTANDVLRTYAPGEGGEGTVLPTSTALSPAGAASETATLVEVGPAGAPGGLVAAGQGAISLSAGGGQTLTVAAGPAFAGAVYLVAGSASGFTPSMPVDGTPVPLVLDAYTLLTLGAPNQPPLAGSLGLLDGGGSAVCTFTVPPGTAPALAGIVLHHAAIALGPILTVDFASNPVAARLLP